MSNELFVIIWLGVLILGFGVLVFFNWWQHRGPTLTGPATVVSRRVEYGKSARGVFTGSKYTGSNCWNYYVTFRLLDGEEIELSAMEYYYSLCKEGSTGQLSWCQDHLYGFECDEIT